MEIQVDYRPFTVEYSEQMGSGPPPRAAAPRQRGGGGGDPVSSVPGGVAAPIAGRVITVMAKQGDTVASGDVLLLLEAMKMENEVKAPMDGTIKEVMVTDGQRVSEGETLIVIE
jgi:biotin carboxyl carrier protein